MVLSSGEQLEGRLSFSRSRDKHRTLEMSLECWKLTAAGARGPSQTMIYTMGVEE